MPFVFSKKRGGGKAAQFPLFFQAVRPYFQISEKMKPMPEWKFSAERKFRFDYAWPSMMVALEIDGGIWSKGGHTSGKGKSRDCEKDFLAACEGWKVIRWTTEMVNIENCGKLLALLEKEILK